MSVNKNREKIRKSVWVENTVKLGCGQKWIFRLYLYNRDFWPHA